MSEYVKRNILESFFCNTKHNFKNITVMNLFWGIVILICIFIIPIYISTLLIYFVALPLLTGVLNGAKIILSGEKFLYRDIFKGAKQFYRKSLIFYALVIVFTGILALTYWQFYITGFYPYLVLCIIQTICYFIIIISQIYTLPLIVHNDMKFLQAFKESFKIFVQNPIYSIKSFFQMFIFLLCSLAGIITIPLFTAGIFSIFSLNTYYFATNKKYKLGE